MNQKKETIPIISTCNCTKSNCKKKYCECFKSGKYCDDKCRCVSCENLKLKKKKIFKKTKIYKTHLNSLNSLNNKDNYGDIDEVFAIEGISIKIVKNKFQYLKKIY
jgi:hypothetical protein